MRWTPSESKRFTPELFVTIVILVGYIIWMMSLPAWPSQDGPVHLYYTHVLGALLSHQPTVYSHYYTIKHLLPPYALYYYALLALSKVVPLLLADRVIVCVYLILFVFGFRFVARRVGPSADRATLLAMLFALNWAAGMGFLNYCLSLALVLWAIGLWLRFSEIGFAARAGFLFLVAIITLTHPVPLLILFTFCGLELLQRWAIEYKFNLPAVLKAPILSDVGVFLLSILALAYVKHFATTHPLSAAQSVTRSFPAQVRHNVLTIVELHNISLVFGHSVATLVYRFSELLTLVVVYAIAIRQRLRNRARNIWTAGDWWLMISVILLILLPMLPSDVSGAFYFTERLTLLIWLAPLLAIAGQDLATSQSKNSARRKGPSTWGSMAALAFAVVSNLCLLWAANDVLRPIASRMAALEHTPRIPAGELALILQDSRPSDPGTAGPFWDAYYWAGAHLLRSNDAVLDNSPWLDSALIPLGATPALPVGASAKGDSAGPHELSLKLLSSPSFRAEVLAPVQMVFITQPGRPAATQLDPLLASTAGSGRPWNCHMVSDWYQLCTASGADKTPAQISAATRSSLPTYPNKDVAGEN